MEKSNSKWFGGTIFLDFRYCVTSTQGGIGATSLTDTVLISQDSGTDEIDSCTYIKRTNHHWWCEMDPFSTISGTSNEVEITNGANSIQIGLPNDVTIGGDLTISGGDIDLTGATDIDLVDNNAQIIIR